MKLKNLLNPFYLYENKALVMPRLKVALGRWLRSQGIPLTASDRQVAALKNRHRGNRCFIIGNGPSLKIDDLERLKGEVTFACNKIYLAFDQTDWRPTYYSVLDVLVAETNKAVIDGLELRKIFCINVMPYFADAKDIIWLHTIPEPYLEGDRQGAFSLDVLEGVYGGWTVIFPLIQLAYYMGIREIYLLGVDFSFSVPESTGRMCASGEILEYQGEVNHFHPEYRKPGEQWTVPRLDKQYKAFRAAKKVVESHGGHIFNASRKTALDVFPIVDFDALVNSKSEKGTS